MPKLKCATAAHRANQAKKRKRNQRQDPVRHQEEQECNTAARRLLRVTNPERREQEQQQDTIGNSIKVTCNTIIYSDIIAHRVARENPVQRMDEQQRDLLHHREARSDPEYQTREQHINNMRR